MKKKTIKGLISYILILLVGFFDIYSEIINSIIAIVTLGLSFLLVYKYRKNIVLFIVSLFIAYSNYSIIVGVYLFPDIRPYVLYSQISDVEVYGIGIMMLSLFMIALLIFMPEDKASLAMFSLNFIIEENENHLIYISSLVIFITIIFLGYDRAEIGRGNSSPLYEYGIIFLIAMFYYSGNKTKYKIFAYISATIYILTSISNGTRVEAIMCLLVVVLSGIRRELPMRFFIIGAIAFAIILNMVGIYRGNYTSLLSGIAQSTSKLIENKLVFDTCIYAYFPALSMIEKFKNYTLSNSIYFFSKFIASVAAGQSRIVDGDLIVFVRKYYFHNYGGVITGFFYVWFSYWGSLILGWIIGQYFKLFPYLNIYKGSLTSIIILYVASTIPRWYLYGPWPLTRGVLICCLVFYAFNLISIRKKNLRNLFEAKE